MALKEYRVTALDRIGKREFTVEISASNEAIAREYGRKKAAERVAKAWHADHLGILKVEEIIK